MDTHMKHTVTTFIQQQLSPVFLMVFGSYASGNIHPRSDLDLAFFKTHIPIDAYTRFTLAQELAGLLNLEKVDLIDLSSVSTIFRAEILSSGALLSCSNSDFFDTYHATALSMYAHLNEKMAPVLKEIQESRRIYG